MRASKLISEFYNDDNVVVATVFKTIGLEDEYTVSFKDDTGTSYSAVFSTLDDAEEYAEDRAIGNA